MDIAEEAILSFVRSSIKSAWTLELLLLLYRNRERSWRLEQLVRELRGSAALVAESLKALGNIGLITQIESETYCYTPKSPELDALVAALIKYYAVKPITVLRTIFTSPSEKIKSFSDAFLLKKGEGT
jgi:DNA-binding HxlR family transcriptional regulator